MRADLVGKRFERLLVIAPAGVNARQNTLWLCRCDCGTEKVIARNSLGWSTKSCGCLLREKATERMRIIGKKNKHGMNGTPEHRTYCHAKERCTNPNHHNFRHYGGRGVKFLFNSFEEFYSELGPRPKGMTLDRIDVNGNYEPGNVRWATLSVQQSNKRPEYFKQLAEAGFRGNASRWASYRKNKEMGKSEVSQ